VVHARIGFRVPSVDLALAALKDYPEAVVSGARDSEWGRRAIVADPDGNRVELLQS
jgi:predicted enzyme related to lactoylglutathione lyase